MVLGLWDAFLAFRSVNSLATVMKPHRPVFVPDVVFGVYLIVFLKTDENVREDDVFGTNGAVKGRGLQRILIVKPGKKGNISVVLDADFANTEIREMFRIDCKKVYEKRPNKGGKGVEGLLSRQLRTNMTRRQLRNNTLGWTKRRFE